MVIRGRWKNGLYYLIGKTVNSNATPVMQKFCDISKLWHLRSGHVSEKAILELSEQGYFGTDKLGKLEFCEECVRGKAHRASFNQAIHKTQERLEYVHSDLWGPARVNSHGESR